MRRDPTPAERWFWQAVRAERLDGLKFRRQEPLLGFIANFVCFEERLIVELDGWQHGENRSDAARDAAFAEAGFLTLRFANEAVLDDVDAVAAVVLTEARRRRPL